MSDDVLKEDNLIEKIAHNICCDADGWVYVVARRAGSTSS
jgi:hypothetical protein